MTKIEQNTIEALIEDTLKTYDDACNRLDLTLDARERADWIALIKECGETLEELLKHYPENKIKINTKH